MQQRSDAELLSAYVQQHSEEAFKVLVDRYLPLVYSAALRQVSEPHLAQDAAQAVFIILAQKANTLNQRTVLAGWLCHTARFVARNAIKMEHRRREREQEAYMQSATDQPDDSTWKQLAPLLDEAVAQLNVHDRNAIVLRFYERRSLVAVGRGLGIDADAAQKRVARAIDKLRKIFVRRGVAISGMALGNALVANSVQAAPMGLAQAISAVAITKGATAGISTLTLANGALKLMALTKIQTAIISGTVVLLFATTAVSVVEYQKYRMYQWQEQTATAATLQAAEPQASLLSSKPHKENGMFVLEGGDAGGGVVGLGVPLQGVIQAACTIYGVHKTPIVFDVAVPPDDLYDFLIKKKGNWHNILQQLLVKKCGLTVDKETRDTDVYVLKCIRSQGTGMTPAPYERAGMNIVDQQTDYTFQGNPIKTLAFLLETHLPKTVVDQTGLDGFYNFSLHWTEAQPGHVTLEELNQALEQQLGLELVEANLPTEVVVVKKL